MHKKRCGYLRRQRLAAMGWEDTPENPVRKTPGRPSIYNNTEEMWAEFQSAEKSLRVAVEMENYELAARLRDQRVRRTRRGESVGLSSPWKG